LAHNYFDRELSKSLTASYAHRYAQLKKKPTTQIAHLVFADTKANAKKPKELFSSNA